MSVLPVVSATTKEPTKDDKSDVLTMIGGSGKGSPVDANDATYGSGVDNKAVEKERLYWVGFGLPFRGAASTFEKWEQDKTFPVVDTRRLITDSVTKLFDHIRSAADVYENRDLLMSIRSPTHCEIPQNDSLHIQSERPLIYVYEGNGGISWAVDRETGRVYSYFDSQVLCVAQSLPEFWARIAIESEIYWASVISNQQHFTRELLLLSTLGDGSEMTPERVWNEIIGHYFSTEQRQYLEPFYNKFTLNLKLYDPDHDPNPHHTKVAPIPPLPSKPPPQKDRGSEGFSIPLILGAAIGLAALIGIAIAWKRRS
jgi:hypothetical protein